ncbi:Uma2 family endonuclease [Amycolatopsis saalfeldensis]|uniref:Endonuclease, Uma2 family (Restriction endonuclease fold) n=1 Tax=Amycolatopsis saalfeldensis TaxID=394193 RepID=A0A1H8WZ43_9PSEU|nr:Uma2 family endonuclease [Amycolatopsis saalfeldensis]SEP32886.1 Endonuclease, Uma2 family (restriction endonuclease fold) [Amycolatopsis saalfeldensis]
MAAPAEPEFRVASRLDGWTVDQVLALPEEHTSGNRVELVDGVLNVSPAPTSAHQRLLQRLQLAFAPRLPEGTELLPGVNVRFGEKRLLIPDFVVLTCPAVDTTWYSATDLLLVAEIESPSTRVQDRILKKALYAEALIPYYLLVDPAQEPVAATVFGLDGGEYVPIGKSEGGVLELAEPFAARVDLRG